MTEFVLRCELLNQDEIVDVVLLQKIREQQTNRTTTHDQHPDDLVRARLLFVMIVVVVVQVGIGLMVSAKIIVR